MNKKILMVLCLAVIVAIAIAIVAFVAFKPQQATEPREPPEVEIINLTRIYPDYETIRILVTLKNHEGYKVEVELKFTTEWDNKTQDTAYKTLTINSKDTQMANAELKAQHISMGTTEYHCEIVSTKKAT